MFRKELLTIGLLATGVFLVVAGVCAWLTWSLAQDARMLVVDTIPGLVNAGDALNVMDNNWQKMIELPELPSSQARSNLVVQITARSTTEFWLRYQTSVLDAQDRELFAAAQSARQNFLTVRNEFFLLAQGDDVAGALEVLRSRLTPAYAAYRQAATQLFELNEQIGAERSGRIRVLSMWLPLIAAVASVIIFGLGFLLGLRGALSGFDYVAKRFLTKAVMEVKEQTGRR